MQNLINFLSKEKNLVLLFSLLLIPAMFINLGVQPLTADEPTRAVVALEMEYSGNYIVSTINEVFYYKKPPLFNWLICAAFQISGSPSEFVLRLTAVLPMLLFGWYLYKVFKRYTNPKIAFLSVAMFLTNARVISYDSYLGHIDMLYSWITFITFIVIYEGLKKEKYLMLFVVSYFLSALAFLLKGLPTFIFQGTTLIVCFWMMGRFKKLFSLWHLIGILAFVIPVAGFFYTYNQYNELWGWVDQLWDQSKQRTVLDKAWYENFIHLFKFPVDHVGHLAPWSLLAVPLFYKSIRNKIAENEFVKMMGIIMVANLPAYWLSPGYYPRYLLMLYPIIFLILAFAWENKNELLKSYEKDLFKVFAGLGVLISFGPLVLLLIDLGIPINPIFSVLITISLLFLSYLMFRKSQMTLYFLALFILVLRIEFNLVAFPHRASTGGVAEYKEFAEQIVEKSKGKKLYTISGVNHAVSFYIERERGEILKRVDFPDTTSYYIIFSDEIFGDYQTIIDYHLSIENRR